MVRATIVNEIMCPTCPFREGSPAAMLRSYFEETALNNSRICHSTGRNRVIKESKQISKIPMFCRGSRNYQLQVLAAMGFLDAPTDEAWAKKQATMKGKKANNEEKHNDHDQTRRDYRSGRSNSGVGRSERQVRTKANAQKSNCKKETKKESKIKKGNK